MFGLCGDFIEKNVKFISLGVSKNCVRHRLACFLNAYYEYYDVDVEIFGADIVIHDTETAEKLAVIMFSTGEAFTAEQKESMKTLKAQHKYYITITIDEEQEITFQVKIAKN